MITRLSAWAVRPAVLGLVLLLIVLFSSSEAPTPALAFAPTGDEFNGAGLDPTFWNTSTLTSGARWCLPATPDDWRDMATVSCSGIQAGPYGTATVSGGELTVAGAGKRAYTYFWSNDGMLPSSGDFVIEFRYKRDTASTPNGGVVIRRWDDPTPSGTNSPFGEPSDCSLLALWNDGELSMLRTGDFATGGGINSLPMSSFNSYHVYTFEYVNGKYLAFVDGVMTIGPVSSIERANRVWVGSPGAYAANATWSTFSADYIRVSQPAFIDADNNGQYDGAQVWTPTHLTAGSQVDSDGDGYPNACDPQPNTAETGSLAVTEQTIPDADPQTFDFTGAVTGTRADGGTLSATVDSGVRTVTQSPLASGWALLSITCDDPESVADPATRTVTLTVQKLETINCTFTNTKCPAGVLPPWSVPPGDGDCDGFSSTDEGVIGTNADVWCGTGNWPSDFDNSKVINISDVFFVLPPTFGTAVPPTSARRDLVPDGVINISDVFKVLPPYFGSSCA